MTKELAIELLNDNKVYLTEEGRQLLESLLFDKEELTSNVSSNSSVR